MRAATAKKWVRSCQCGFVWSARRRYASLTSAVGLQGVVGPFTPHVTMSELAQLVIDQRREFIGLGALPIAGGRQQIAESVAVKASRRPYKQRIPQPDEA